MFVNDWNIIVSEYKECKFKPESIVQKSWETYFSEIFGYKKIYNEIDTQRTIHIGSKERIIPDIIIRQNGIDLFDVELKQYNLPLSSDMEMQLISYMNQLHISVGVLICEKLYVYIYYYDLRKHKKIEIPFEENNPDGIKFVELFKSGNFAKEKIEAFIDSKKDFENNVKRIKSELTQEKILEILRQHFSLSYSHEEINKAINQVKINIKFPESPTPPPTTPSPMPVYPKYPTTKNTDRYLFENESYNKTRLVHAVIKAFVRDNPDFTYAMLRATFPSKLQGSYEIVLTPDEARRKSSDVDKRYRMKPEDRIILRDGTKLVVCSQWGSGLNFENFIKKAESLGYSITPVHNL